MEACTKCGAEALEGMLIRDSVDAALLYCEKCRPIEKKPRKPRKKKEIPVKTQVVAIDEAKVRFETNPPPPIDPVALRKDAQDWATECGLGPVRANGPTREDYPRYGFGYSFQIQEISGKERKASARYTCRGERSYWTIDGIVTG